MSRAPGHTRRMLLARGLAAGGGVTLALGAAALRAPAATDTDAQVLAGLVAVEQTAVAAYGKLAGTGALTRAQADFARLCASAGRRQQAELGGRAGAAGAAAGKRPAMPSQSALANARTRPQALAFAVQLESSAVAAYHDAIGRLHDASSLRTVASVVAAHGLRLASWRVAAGADPLPRALETGSAP